MGSSDLPPPTPSCIGSCASPSLVPLLCFPISGSAIVLPLGSRSAVALIRLKGETTVAVCSSLLQDSGPLGHVLDMFSFVVK